MKDNKASLYKYRQLAFKEFLIRDKSVSVHHKNFLDTGNKNV